MNGSKDLFVTIPLERYGTIPIGVGRDCFVLICFRSKLKGAVSGITIPDRDKKLIGLNRLSYYRGIKILEKLGIISVIKGDGKACRITTASIDQLFCAGS